MNKLLSEIKIVPLLQEDLNSFSELTPDGWGDITLVYQLHYGQAYFFPIKLIHKKKIIGVAELILNKNTGWLGNIVVSKTYRNNGLGRVLTQRLVEMAKAKKCKSIYLLATPLGKSVYEKLGFIENGKYLFFKTTEKSITEYFSNNIITYHPKYKNEILQLDREANGEDRSEVLALHLEDVLIYKQEGEEKINGFFFPTLANGLIICNNQHAGLELIKKREAMGNNTIALPEACTETIRFLQQRNYKEYRQATFMHIGAMKIWKPQMIYSRIGGYLG